MGFFLDRNFADNYFSANYFNIKAGYWNHPESDCHKH